MASNQSKETKMIVKIGKDKKELESWETVELAAKAAGVSPKVLKSHLYKKKPPKLGGFVFIEKKNVEFAKDMVKQAYRETVSEAQKEMISNIEPVKPEPPNPALEKITPEYAQIAFDNLYTSTITTEDIKTITDIWEQNPNPGPTMVLNEFGEAVELKPVDLPEDYVELENVEMLGHTSLPVEAFDEEPVEIDLDWLLTPIQRRLKRMKNAGR